MTEDRWLDTQSETLGQTLIEAGRAERPSDAALGRTLAAISAGATVVTVAGKTGAAVVGTSGAALGASSGTLTVAKSSAGIAVGKWVLGGLVGGAVAGATALGVVELSSDAPVIERTQSSQAPPEVVAPAKKPSVTVTEHAAAESDDTAEEAVEAPVETPSRALVRRESSVKPAPAAESPRVEIREGGSVSGQQAPTRLEAELALIDEARALLDGGNSQAALLKLAEYRGRFPRGGLGPEALFLEMRAHEVQGNVSGARAAAEKILARYPRGPHAARAKNVLGR